jgi:tight adherence protein B
MLILILFLMFLSIGLLAGVLVPLMVTKSGQLSKDHATTVVGKVSQYLREDEIEKMYKLTFFGPVALGLGGMLLFPPGKRVIGLICGVFFGYLLPRMYVGNLISQRKKKFDEQLLDAIMIMSSSFRGGLSLVQAFESVSDEMPEPAKGEFRVVLGENKMGVSLDESLNRLFLRMPSSAMQQTVTAVLLARETGGNLPAIFTRIVNSTRERRKIEKNLQTLTVQGKIQGVVMSGLPVFFFFTVSGSNPHYFDIMFNTDIGQELLVASVVLWCLGAVSIWQISTFKDV